MAETKVTEGKQLEVFKWRRFIKRHAVRISLALLGMIGASIYSYFGALWVAPSFDCYFRPPVGCDHAPHVETRLPPVTAPKPVSTKSATFGVFPGMRFNLCGKNGFEAQTSRQGIVLKSSDTTIPGVGFRGFEKLVPLETHLQLWAGCEVIITSDVIEGIGRVAITVIQDGGA